jgi:hypothetical protein
MKYTYQDLLNVGNGERERMNFVLGAINGHKLEDDYLIALDAEEYNAHKNVTIRKFQKLLYTVTGKAIPDNFSANFKMACRHFHRFIVQENQFLLGNGASWDNDIIESKLGNKKKPFDTQLQLLGKKALIQGLVFGFYNLDHVDMFALTEFVPLWDEEDGSLKSGIRFWQISPSKPLRATLYELDGYTDIIWRVGEDYEILTPKRPYKLNVAYSEIDGTEILDGENYPGFPIIPMWANSEHQSELVGLREQIDCYDLIKSGFANTVDEASYVFWTIQNASGMDDVDLAQFVERMKTLHAAVVDDDGAKAESHQQEVPYAAREALLDRLDKDLYRDAMALDVESIASGAATATEIRAAYEPLNAKCDDFEYCVKQFITALLDIAGLDGKVSFTRSTIVNTAEDINSVIAASAYLSESYVTRKILDIFGDGDQAEAMLEEMDANELERGGNVVNIDNGDEGMNDESEET